MRAFFRSLCLAPDFEWRFRAGQQRRSKGSGARDRGRTSGGPLGFAVRGVDKSTQSKLQTAVAAERTRNVP